MKIELSKEEINQLLNLMNRVNIQGAEASIFLQLVQKIQRQVQSQQMASPAPEEKLNKPSKEKK